MLKFAFKTPKDVRKKIWDGKKKKNFERSRTPMERKRPSADLWPQNWTKMAIFGSKSRGTKTSIFGVFLRQRYIGIRGPPMPPQKLVERPKYVVAVLPDWKSGNPNWHAVWLPNESRGHRPAGYYSNGCKLSTKCHGRKQKKSFIVVT